MISQKSWIIISTETFCRVLYFPTSPVYARNDKDSSMLFHNAYVCVYMCEVCRRKCEGFLPLSSRASDHAWTGDDWLVVSDSIWTTMNYFLYQAARIDLSLPALVQMNQTESVSSSQPRLSSSDCAHLCFLSSLRSLPSQSDFLLSLSPRVVFAVRPKSQRATFRSSEREIYSSKMRLVYIVEPRVVWGRNGAGERDTKKQSWSNTTICQFTYGNYISNDSKEEEEKKLVPVGSTWSICAVTNVPLKGTYLLRNYLTKKKNERKKKNKKLPWVIVQLWGEKIG